MLRMIGEDGGVAIQMQTNGITMQKVPGQGAIAFDNRRAIMGEIPSEEEKAPKPVQISTRERPGMPPEEVYKFEDASHNQYTFFSHSGDFLVESPDKRVGSLVLPDGTIHTRVVGNSGVYEARYHPMQGMQVSNGAQYNPSQPELLYLPTDRGEPQFVAMPYPVRANMGLVASGGMPGPPVPVSGELPEAFKQG